MTMVKTDFTCTNIANLQIIQIIECCKYVNELRPY